MAPRATAAAFSENKQANRQDFALWKVWLVAGDCCLIGLQPVLVHLSKNGKDAYAFHPVSISVLVEIVKTTFALLVLFNKGTGRPGPPMYSSLRSFVRDARLNRSLVVPAGLYAINNYLKFMMQLYFKPTTAKMLGNLKVLVIAVLMKFVLGRTFSLFQWEALLMLCVGITINQLDHCMSSAVAVPAVAVAYTAASVVVPSLASIFNERALKRHMDTSVHLQNFYLYFFGLSANSLGWLLLCLASGRPPASLFRGHSKFTVMLVVNGALQGLLSSFFYKYADTILKKYSSTIATIYTALLSALLFGHHLTLNLGLAIITVFCSMHQFFGQGGLKVKLSDNVNSQTKSKSTAESIRSMEADFADPDNLHLATPRRQSLLPR